MIEINDKLDEKLRQQMDGKLEEDEELQLRFVAKAYAMCENTVDRHRQNIISKMQASNMAEACHKAKQLGLL